MSRGLLVVFLLLMALGAVACGGGDDDVDVDAVLRETFGDDKDINSGRLDLDLRLDARGLAQLTGPVRARLSGPFESSDPDQLPRFSLEAEIDAGGQAIRAGATSTGDKGFLSFQGQAYALSDDLYQEFKRSYAEEAGKNQDEGGGVSFQSLGIDPRRWLRDPEYEGKEEVGGAETLHIRAGIDVPRLLEDVNRILSRAEQIQSEQARQLTEAERRQIAEAINEARLDLWTGEEDKIIRRLAVELQFDVPEANRQQAQGLTGGTLRFQLGLGAINSEQDISAPEGARPFDELMQQLAAGTAAVPGQGSETPEAAGTPYEECVQEAGADIAKLQECAALSGG